jgi:hypothetical protein
METRSDFIVEGNIAHVMNCYASRRNLGEAPFEHGVNSSELGRLDGIRRHSPLFPLSRKDAVERGSKGLLVPRPVGFRAAGLHTGASQ